MKQQYIFGLFARTGYLTPKGPHVIRKMAFLVLLTVLALTPALGQVILIDPTTDGGFETGTTFAANGWTAVNPANANRDWYVGTGQAGYTGNRCAFIGNNTTTVGTNTAARTVHIYRSVTFPAGATNIQLSFKYKQAVSDYSAGTYYDYVAVYTGTAAPVSGSLPAGTLAFGPYPQANVTSFTAQSATLPNSLAGTTTNLIFTFNADAITPHGYGAIDDIQLTYTAPVACSGTPAASTTASTTTTACNGVNFTLSLGTSYGATGITYQWQSADDASFTLNVSNLGTAATQVTNQTAAKYYRCKVTCSNGGAFINSTPLLVNMASSACTQCSICTAAATSTSTLFEKISNVKLNTINNTSASFAGYEDFTAVSTSLTAGQSYTFTATSVNGYAQDQLLVWIDFNQNGLFTDAGENVFASAVGAGPFTGTITIPSGASIGSTRMRVRLHDTSSGANATSCGTSTYGQVEDYCVSITQPTNNDAGISTITTQYCPGTQTVQASIKNFGLLTLNTATVNWTVNGVAQTPVNLTGLGLATGAVSVINLGSYTFTGGTNYTVVAATSLPNGAADGNAGNDSFTSATFQTALSGTYTVGVGGNFTTLTAAVNMANTYGLCGPTVFALTDAAYAGETFPIVINQLAGASAVNTLSIRPNTGVNALINGNYAGGLIRLNGADYITIDGSNTVGGTSRNLTVNNANNTTDAAVIWLSSVATPANGTTNNTIKNCVLSGNSNTTTFAGIMCSGSVMGDIAEAANSNNTFRNNQIFRTTDGIDLIGPTGNETGNTITENEIGSAVAGNKIGWSGIFIAQEQNVVVSKNTVAGNTATGTNTATGIEVGGTIDGALIFENKISDIKNTNTGGYGSAGIFLGSSSPAANITIYNNTIRDVASYGFNGFTEEDNGNGIAIYAGGGYKLYHNSVALTGNQTLTGASRAAAILVTSGVTTVGAIDLRDNIFANLQTVGNGNSRFAIVSTAANNVFSFINNNTYYAVSGNLLCKGSNATIYTTLATLQANIGGNANSLAVDPVFVSTTDLHLQLTSTLNAAGAPIAAVTTDIDGEARDAGTPDIGADEFTTTFTWTGATSTDWNTATNWTPTGIPNVCAATAIIPGAPTNQPVVGAATTVGDVTIQTGATLTTNANLSVCGSWTGAGNVVSGTAAVVFTTGTPGGTISGGGTFNNIRIADNITISAGAGNMVNVGNSVALPGGVLTANGNLTLLSGVSGTAYLDDFTLTYTGSVTGDIHVQRYNPIGVAGFRQLGTPVQMPNISAVSGFTPSGTAGFVIPVATCDPNYVAYNSPYGNWMQLVENGTVQYSCSQSLFEVLTSGGMTSGRGYYMDVPGNSTLTFTGAPTTGIVNFGLTHANTAVTNGWNQVSNPYPSPLAWELLNVPVGVDAIGKIWVTSGTYLGTFQDLDPLAAGTQAVAIGQAFQVRVTVPGTSVPFLVDNLDRTTSPPMYLFAGGDPMTLNIDILGNGFADLTKVRFVDGATADLDAQFDSPKMLGNANQPMVYSVWNGKNYSTNSYGQLNEVYTLPLGVKVAQAGQHTLAFSNVDQFPATALIYLEDTENHVWQDIRANDTYVFTHAVGTDETRFLLHFYPPVEHTVADATCEAPGQMVITEASPANWNYVLTDAANATVSQGALNGTQTIGNLIPGNYTLTLTEQTSGYVTVEAVTVSGGVQVSAQALASTLTAETGQEIQFTANSTQAGSWNWNFGDLNTSTEQNPVHIYNAGGTYEVMLTAGNGTCQTVSTLSVAVAAGTASIADAFADAGLKMWNENNVVYLTFAEKWAGKTVFSLYDTQGRKVFQKQLAEALGTYTLDCGELAAGTYTVELKGQTQTVSRKMVMGIK